MAINSVKIVGSGLIGTSIGLALRAAEVSVTMADNDHEAQSLAQDLMGEAGSSGPFDIIIVASPLTTLREVIEGEIATTLNQKFMDISSVKVNPKVEVSSLAIAMSNFLPTHPMAGREVGGAVSARGDLFQSRPWIIDSAGVDPELILLGREVISLCGGHLIDMPSASHDQAVALISHLPQIVSSLLAGSLEGAPAEWLDLAGGGLRDTTRIAESSAQLWREIIVANREALAPLIENAVERLSDLSHHLDNAQYVEDFIKAGNRGRSMIPGKHGGVARNYTYLPVVIEDKPGQLAALFDQCADAGVNVEDLTIEHSPEQFTGLITLALSADDATKLHTHLLSNGWSAHAPR